MSSWEEVEQKNEAAKKRLSEFAGKWWLWSNGLRFKITGDLNQMLEQMLSKFSPFMENEAGHYALSMGANNEDDKEGAKLKVHKYVGWIYMLPKGKP